MTRFRTLLGPLMLLILVTGASLVLAQGTSIGGAFDATRNYILGGSWTYQSKAIPLIFKGTTANNPFATSVTVTTPTANRAWTLPDAAGTTFVGTTATQTLTNKTLTAPVLGGSVTGTYTLAGTPTFTTPTITAPIISTITNTGTLTLPNATGGIPVMLDCGTTGSGSQTCSAATATALSKIYVGHSTLSGSTATITFSPAFTGTTQFDCVANDITTRANPVQMIPASASTAVITNTTGASDVINWICAGN